jgi:hypothetical protein
MPVMMRLVRGQGSHAVEPDVSVALPISPRSPRVVRRFVTLVLAEHEITDAATVDAVELLSSELSTRLLWLSDAGLFTVQVSVETSSVRVAVTGPWFRLPRRPLRAADRLDPSLRILDALAQDWGTPAEDGSHTAWFTVPRP